MKQFFSCLSNIAIIIAVVLYIVYCGLQEDAQYHIFITERQSDSADYLRSVDQYVDSGYAVSRDWFENVWPTYSESTDSQKLRAIFDEIQIARSETEINNFLNLLSYGKDVILFVAVDEEGKIPSDVGLVKNENDIVGCFHVEGDEIDEETLARYVAYAPESDGKGGTKTGDWIEGNRLWYFNYMAKRIGIGDKGKDIYQKSDDNSFVFTKYEIDKVFHLESFNAYGLTCCKYLSAPGNSSVLAIRGTDSPVSALDDANSDGVGFRGFSLGYPLVKNWLEEQTQKGKNVSILGHSLGGALTQWIAAEWTASGNELDKVVTFNSAGISKEFADKCVTSNINEVVHHMSDGDIVSLAGAAFINGRVNVYSYPTEARGLVDYLLQKHTLPLTNDNIPFKTKRPNGITVKVVSTDELNSFWNHPSDERYISYYSLFNQVVFIRGTTEYARKLIGLNLRSFLEEEDADEINPVRVGLADDNFVSLLLKTLGNSVTLTSDAGWALKDINVEHGGFGTGNVKFENGRFFGDVDVQTPNGFSLPGRVYYSNYGLERIQAKRDSSAEALDLGVSFFLKNADLSLSKIDEVQKISAIYPQNLPNLDYSLKGNMTVTFGSDDDLSKMGEIKLNAIKTSPSKDEALGDVAELNVFFQGKKLLDIEPTGEDFTFVGKNRFCGKVKVRFTVYDKAEIEKEGSFDQSANSIEALDSSITFNGGLFDDFVYITAEAEDKETLSFQYDEYETPTLKYGDKTYRYNTKNERWEDSSTPLQTNGIATSINDETVKHIGELNVEVSNGAVAVVSTTVSNLDASSEIFFFLRSQSSEQGDKYLGSVSISEMNLVDGKYVCSFDLEGKNLKNGAYSIYAYTDFESEEEAVYSDQFELRFVPSLVVSSSSCDFGEINVGSLVEGCEQNITISNQSSKTQEFCLCSDSSENFYLLGRDSDGDKLTSYETRLEPNESLTLSIYFIPTTPGEKTATISLLDKDGDILGNVVLSGIALKSSPTGVETTN